MRRGEFLAIVGVGSSASIDVVALSGQTFEGKVTYVNPRVSEGSRTARLRVEVKNPEDRLHAGMFASVRWSVPCRAPAATARAVPAVPADAVLEVEGEQSVFVPVAGETNTFARRAVTLGPRVGGFYPVMDGLIAGDEVVVAGALVWRSRPRKAGAEHAH